MPETPYVPFPKTRTSLLQGLASLEPRAREHALGALAEAYWKPVYVYVRLHWRKPHEDAADATQEFFARAVEKGWLERYDPGRARLRTYLRLCVDGLLANEARAASREKRGGGAPHLSLDFDAARRELEGVLPVDGESPERVFEKEWARHVFGRAAERLERLCHERSRDRAWAIFASCDLEGEPRPSYAELAARYATTVVDVTNQLAFTRRELRRIVLEILREETATEEEFRAEARSLLGLEHPA